MQSLINKFLLTNITHLHTVCVVYSQRMMTQIKLINLLTYISLFPSLLMYFFHYLSITATP